MCIMGVALYTMKMAIRLRVSLRMGSRATEHTLRRMGKDLAELISREIGLKLSYMIEVITLTQQPFISGEKARVMIV